MKKRLFSILTALALCLTLLPGAALAAEEGATLATGVYLSVGANNTPTGNCIPSTNRDGDSGPVGYWNIPYSDTQKIFYYYDPQATCLTVPTEQHGISTEKVSGADHLWKITLGDCERDPVFDLAISENESSTYCFGFVYRSGSSQPGNPSGIPKKGLYYKQLTEGPGQPIHEDGDYIRLDKIELAPYVDRVDIALYYFDGTSSDPELVKRVRLPFGSGFDLVWASEWERDDKLPDNWYYLSAYDFSTSQLYYYAGEGYNSPNATPTGFVTLSSRQLPQTAFYSSEQNANEATYRMYTVMDWNRSSDKDYRYTTTLYLHSTDENFSFSDNSITCSQKRYGGDGYELGMRSLTKGTDYDYTITGSGNVLTVTFYANDSDLLLWLTGPNDQYAAYVNLLAPDGTRIRLNDHGFTAARYLPKHLFQQLSGMRLPITLSAGDYAADVTFDAALTAAIADANTPALAVGTAQKEDVMDAVNSVVGSATFVGAVDITLTYGDDERHQLGGSATISYPCELDLADGETVQVYYVYTANGAEKAEWIEAAYDATTGCVTFTTNHFSTFVIVTVPASSAGPENVPVYIPTYSVTAPAAANGTVTVTPKNAAAGVTVTITTAPKQGYALKNLTVLDQRGNVIPLTDRGNGTYTFQMPAGNITVQAAFVPEKTVEDYFVDVPAGQYYYDAVLWAVTNGITGGVDDSHFGPDQDCQRAQLAAFLYRYAQSQGKGFTGAWMFQLPFGDVPEWCYESVAWCYMNEIVTGYGDALFGSSDDITREQVVTILYRFAVQVLGMDAVTMQELVSGYGDAGEVSDYAIPAMNWALANGIVKGANGDLMPGQSCTRAEIVTMLYRLLARV